ncbi:MAG: hypothetical protein C0399_05440 [Syntrophus sp. (in: bacteria)]|nr:hypothetical protein [Syntrophus sp. (in: bacteria)]
MNKTFPAVICLVFIVFLLNGCAMKHSRVISIQWPQEIGYMEVMGELDISWKDLRYSGEISLKLDYPETLFIEVYGPFGSTIVSIEKDKGRFVMNAGNDVLNDEKRFRDIFKMKIEDFINDITMRGERKRESDGTFSIQREDYRTIYHLNDSENKICWVSPEGTICITFLEINFDKGQPVGKSSNKNMQ